MPVYVPGSFYEGVFPNASINFAYSSAAIHWLSRMPTTVADSSSPAWNKGRIHYSNATNEVIRAYETQYSEDSGHGELPASQRTRDCMCMED
ncbi:hypothetical protein ACLB2K_040499 [Fragaria x ananassa]